MSARPLGSVRPRACPLPSGEAETAIFCNLHWAPKDQETIELLVVSLPLERIIQYPVAEGKELRNAWTQETHSISYNHVF